MNGDNSEGWASKALRDVVQNCQSGFASGQKTVLGGVAHLRMNNIGLDGTLAMELVRHVPRDVAKPQYDLRRGDVLVCTTNSGKLVGKCAYFDLPGRFAFSNHLTRLRPQEAIVDGRYLNWTLWFQWKRGGFEGKCKHWVNQSTLPKATLLGIEIPLPPLAEQRQIVTTLEVLSGKIDKCRRHLARARTLLEQFRQAVLAAACSGRLTADWRNSISPLAGDESDGDLPFAWRRVPLGAVARSFDYGTSAKSQRTGAMPVLRMGNIQDGSIDWSDLAYTSDPREIERYSLRPGTVLFNRTNSPELVGKSSIYRGEQPAIFAGYLIRINVLPELDPEYLNICLNAPYGREFCRRVKTDGVSQSNINAKILATFDIALCSRDEQREIVRLVGECMVAASRINQRLAATETLMESLRSAVIARAFAGQLPALGVQSSLATA